MKRAVLTLAGTAIGLTAVLTYTTPPLQALASGGAEPPTGTAPGTTTAGAGTTTRTLTGTVAQTRWGPVQVAVLLTNGAITQVKVLQSPSGNGRDREIAAYALPLLKAQTLQVQSAEVDVVSGATYTSEGYRTSLQSALDQR